MSAELVTRQEHSASVGTGPPEDNRLSNHPGWPSLSCIPEIITALIPMRRFTVQALLLLEVGQVIVSDSSIVEDIPIKIGQVELVRGEFEVIEMIVALRVTRVA